MRLLINDSSDAKLEARFVVELRSAPKAKLVVSDVCFVFLVATEGVLRMSSILFSFGADDVLIGLSDPQLPVCPSQEARSSITIL